MRAFGRPDRRMQVSRRTWASARRQYRPLFETLERRGMLSATVDSPADDAGPECLVVSSDPGTHEWQEPDVTPDDFGTVVSPVVTWETVEFGDVPAAAPEDGLGGFSPAEPCTEVDVDVVVMFSCMGYPVSEPDGADMTEPADHADAAAEAASGFAVPAAVVADTGSIRRDPVRLPARVHQDLAAVAVWFTTVNTGGADVAIVPVGKRRTR